MARTTEWATKVMAVLKTGNTTAAIAQIKVAPTVKDLLSLQAALAAAQQSTRWPNVTTALQDSLAALSAPRLHRSP